MAVGETERPEEGAAILGLPRNLVLRVVSTVVILPPAGLVLVLGGPYFAVLVALIAGCMAWEWVRIVEGGGASAVAVLASIGSGGVVALSVLVGPSMLVYVLLAFLALMLLSISLLRGPRGGWTIAGCIVACVPCLAALWLRAGTDPMGLLLLIWLTASVVATDIGAYVAGKSIGGARLAPSISPNKTWAGLIGGMAASGAVGWICGVSIENADPAILAGVGAVIAVVAQIGDLLESLFKRRFSVKDSGALIPGHGGVLDRLDGHMTVITVMALIAMVSGQTPLIW
jgi:phosphatidate cytidylyltransferase